MTVVRWNPLREFDHLFARSALPATRLNAARFTPAADVSETAGGYLIELELPGLAAEDVSVTVEDGVLSVAGERRASYIRDVAEDDDSQAQPEERKVHRAERHYGKFERRFRLPEDVDADAISASARNGVLSLAIGRRENDSRRAIEVKVA